MTNLELQARTEERSRPLRICVVTGSHWSAVQGGAQYQAKCLVERIVRGGNAEVFYLARKIHAAGEGAGYTACRIGHRGLIGRQGFFVDALSLLRTLRKIQPDVIYQRGLQAYTGIAALYCRRHPCRFVFHIAHDYDVTPAAELHRSWRSPGKRIDRAIGSYGVRAAFAVIAQTRHQAALLRETYGRECALMVPNFHPAPDVIEKKRGATTRVVWVANFKPIKRPEMAVELAGTLAGRRDIEFVMIGRSGDGRIYGSLLERIGAARNIAYLGERSIEEVNSVLEGADIFLNTSVAEGFPNTFIQAWLREVPVISFDVDPDGALEAEGLGFMVKDVESARRRICELSDDAALREEMGRRARCYAMERHSMRNADAIMSLIEGRSSGASVC